MSLDEHDQTEAEAPTAEEQAPDRRQQSDRKPPERQGGGDKNQDDQKKKSSPLDQDHRCAGDPLAHRRRRVLLPVDAERRIDRRRLHGWPFGHDLAKDFRLCRPIAGQRQPARQGGRRARQDRRPRLRHRAGQRPRDAGAGHGAEAFGRVRHRDCPQELPRAAAAGAGRIAASAGPAVPGADGLQAPAFRGKSRHHAAEHRTNRRPICNWRKAG